MGKNFLIEQLPLIFKDQTRTGILVFLYSLYSKCVFFFFLIFEGNDSYFTGEWMIHLIELYEKF